MAGVAQVVLPNPPVQVAVAVDGAGRGCAVVAPARRPECSGRLVGNMGDQINGLTEVGTEAIGVGRVERNGVDLSGIVVAVVNLIAAGIGQAFQFAQCCAAGAIGVAYGLGPGGLDLGCGFAQVLGFADQPSPAVVGIGRHPGFVVDLGQFAVVVRVGVAGAAVVGKDGVGAGGVIDDGEPVQGVVAKGGELAAGVGALFEVAGGVIGGQGGHAAVGANDLAQVAQAVDCVSGFEAARIGDLGQLVAPVVGQADNRVGGAGFGFRLDDLDVAIQTVVSQVGGNRRVGRVGVQRTDNLAAVALGVIVITGVAHLPGGAVGVHGQAGADNKI